MKEYTVSVRTVDGSFKKTTEVPSDMILRDFKEAAAEILGLSGIPTYLIHEETHQLVKDNLTFKELDINDGAVFVLVPEAEGGGDDRLLHRPPSKVNELFLKVIYQDQCTELSVSENTSIYLLLTSALNIFLEQEVSEIHETNNYKILLKRTNKFLNKTKDLAQENILNNDELIIVLDLKDPIDQIQADYQIPQNIQDGFSISAPVSIPKQKDMAISLIPADIVYRLEEYRSDQHYWESVMWTLVGAILAVIVNWSTSETLVISRTSVVILMMLFIFLVITFTSATKYRKRADKMKKQMISTFKSDYPD